MSKYSHCHYYSNLYCVYSFRSLNQQIIIVYYAVEDMQVYSINAGYNSICQQMHDNVIDCHDSMFR